MRKSDPVAGEAYKPGRLGLADRLAATAIQAQRRGGDLRGRAPSGRGRDQERGPGRRAQLIQAGAEPLPDHGAGLQRHLGHLRASELLRGQGRRQLHQRERVTAGLSVQPPGHRRRRPDPGDSLDQQRRRVVSEPAQLPARQAGRCQGAFAQRHHAGDRVAAQAAHREQQSLAAHRIQPVQIIHQDQQRAVFGRGGQQAVGARRHRQAIRSSPAATLAERRLQRRGLPLRQRRQIASHRMQQRVQAGEGQLRLRLDPGRPQDPHRPGAGGGIVHQRGLPDTRVAPQHQHSAGPGPCLLE